MIQIKNLRRQKKSLDGKDPQVDMVTDAQKTETNGAKDPVPSSVPEGKEDDNNNVATSSNSNAKIPQNISKQTDPKPESSVVDLSGKTLHLFAKFMRCH